MQNKVRHFLVPLITYIVTKNKLAVLIQQRFILVENSSGFITIL